MTSFIRQFCLINNLQRTYTVRSWKLHFFVWTAHCVNDKEMYSEMSVPPYQCLCLTFIYGLRILHVVKALILDLVGVLFLYILQFVIPMCILYMYKIYCHLQSLNMTENVCVTFAFSFNFFITIFVYQSQSWFYDYKCLLLK